MPYYVTYDAKNEYVITLIQGDISKQLLRKFFTKMVQVAAEHNCTRIISDLRVATINTRYEDITAMGEELRDLKVPTSFKRAIVISADHTDYQFWEKVCQKQGYTQVKIFDDYSQAKSWLLGEPDQPHP